MPIIFTDKEVEAQKSMRGSVCMFLSVFRVCTPVFKEYFLSTCHVPGTVLGTRDLESCRGHHLELVALSWGEKQIKKLE